MKYCTTLYVGFDVHKNMINVAHVSSNPGGRGHLRRTYWQEIWFAVGTSVTGRPPHRSVLDELHHTALTLGY